MKLRIFLHRDNDILREAAWRLRNTGHSVIESFGDGLHHSYVEALMQRYGEMDLWCWTQNPAVLDRLAFESAQDVHGRLWVVDDDGTLQQITVFEADGIWRALQAGIQHVSEILSTRGIW